MRRIRINNEFTHHWAIELDGAPVDLTALQKRLYLIHPRETKEVKQFETNGNIISIELTKALLNIVGVYSLELHYELPDPTRDNGIRSCAVDIRLCQIVATTEQADEISEFTTTSDMAFGFQGKSAYGVWLDDNPESSKDDYYDWLRQPATDIEETVGQQEILREAAESLRVEAELLRQSNTQEAINNAEEATLNANNAAANADDAREAIEGDLASKTESEIFSEVEYREVELKNNIAIL